MVETLSDTQVAPQTDSAVVLSAPSALPNLPPIVGNPLRFAPGTTAAPRPLPARPKPLARRRPPTVLFDLAVVGLIVACMAACVYRLFWAMQP